MVFGAETEQPVSVVFTGTRKELGGMLLRGYALLLPTIGLYRFWLTTWKRRFYWSHTAIDGDALEYTGNAVQLLMGFLMALAIFIPLYGLFFYLSTQSTDAVLAGYGGAAVMLWFLVGYAIYRARDFRLSRTLWRGIRFDQGGSAWAYALRRFGWTLLMGITLGLVYPFMAVSLWRYRYTHSWFGDRQFSFTGGWKSLAAPYYVCWLLSAIIGGVTLGVATSTGGISASGQISEIGYVVFACGALPIGLLVLFYQSREWTRMWSSVRLGQAALTIKIRFRDLVGQYALFALALGGVYLALAIGGFIVLGVSASGAFAEGSFDPAVFFQYLRGSFVVLVLVVLGYLLILGAFAMMSELFLGLGFWKLVARGTTITGIESLRTVQARGEDTAVGGEGLADALNVGAY
jgi:uncharacterized membrane protein YjgN (DUF898 family)